MGFEWTRRMPGALLLAIAMLAALVAQVPPVAAEEPFSGSPTTDALRRSHVAAAAERSEFTLETLSRQYQAKRGRAGAGLAHHFLNLICAATDPDTHAGRCPDAPYLDWRWADRFTGDMLYLTALDFQGPRARDYRLIQGVVHPLLGSCAPEGLTCGGDLSTFAGVVYHLTSQLAPFFSIVIDAQMEDVIAAGDADDAPERLAAFIGALRVEHGELLSALRRGITLLAADGEIALVGQLLGAFIPSIAIGLRESTILSVLNARLAPADAASTYALSIAAR